MPILSLLQVISNGGSIAIILFQCYLNTNTITTYNLQIVNRYRNDRTFSCRLSDCYYRRRVPRWFTIILSIILLLGILSTYFLLQPYGITTEGTTPPYIIPPPVQEICVKVDDGSAFHRRLIGEVLDYRKNRFFNIQWSGDDSVLYMDHLKQIVLWKVTEEEPEVLLRSYLVKLLNIQQMKISGDRKYLLLAYNYTGDFENKVIGLSDWFAYDIKDNNIEFFEKNRDKALKVPHDKLHDAVFSPVGHMLVGLDMLLRRLFNFPAIKKDTFAEREGLVKNYCSSIEQDNRIFLDHGPFKFLSFAIPTPQMPHNLKYFAKAMKKRCIYNDSVAATVMSEVCLAFYDKYTKERMYPLRNCFQHVKEKIFRNTGLVRKGGDPERTGGVRIFLLTKVIKRESTSVNRGYVPEPGMAYKLGPLINKRTVETTPDGRVSVMCNTFRTPYSWRTNYELFGYFISRKTQDWADHTNTTFHHINAQDSGYPPKSFVFKPEPLNIQTKPCLLTCSSSDHPKSSITIDDIWYICIRPICFEKENYIVSPNGYSVEDIYSWDLNGYAYFLASPQNDTRYRHLYKVYIEPNQTDQKNDAECLTCSDESDTVSDKVDTRYGLNFSDLGESPHCAYVLQASFSSTSKHYILECGGPDPPWTVVVETEKNLVLKILSTSSHLRETQKHFITGDTEDWEETYKKGCKGWIRLYYPKQEPGIGLIVHVDGYIGTQLVTHKWRLDWNNHFAATRNVYVAEIDGRGSGGGPRSCIAEVFQNLPDIHVEDLLQGIRKVKNVLSAKTNIKNVAIWGEEFGGYIALSTYQAVVKDDPVITCAVAVSPIVDWKEINFHFSTWLLGYFNKKEEGKLHRWSKADTLLKSDDPKMNFRGKPILVIDGTYNRQVLPDQTSRLSRTLWYDMATSHFIHITYADKGSPITLSSTRTIRDMEKFIMRYFINKE